MKVSSVLSASTQSEHFRIACIIKNKNRKQKTENRVRKLLELRGKKNEGQNKNDKVTEFSHEQ